jgi:hypothetical protein
VRVIDKLGRLGGTTWHFESLEFGYLMFNVMIFRESGIHGALKI